MNTITKELLQVSSENLQKTVKSIVEFADRRKLEITGEISSDLPVFPSLTKKKAFQKSMERVIAHPTMKRCNLFFHYLGKYSNSTASLEYSEKERAIIASRRAWQQSMKETERLRIEYREAKGDFYKQS